MKAIILDYGFRVIIVSVKQYKLNYDFKNEKWLYASDWILEFGL